MKEEYLYDVVETNENGRNVVSAPEIWIEDNVLSWPPKGAFTKRKNPTPPEDGWNKIPCIILKKGLTSLKSALVEEKRLSQFSNTESEAEEQRKRNYKKKHPVLSQNPIDFNQQFNKIKASKEKVKEAKQMNTIIFDPVVPEEMMASASTDNNCQENDFNVIFSIPRHGEDNSPNPSNNNMYEGQAMSTTTDTTSANSTPAKPIIISVPAASNSNVIDSTYTSLTSMVPNYYYYPHPHMYTNLNNFGNANPGFAQNNMIPVQYQTNGQGVPSTYTYTNATNVNSADNRSSTHPSLQQPSSSSLKGLPPPIQYPIFTNISPNSPPVNVHRSTIASTSMVNSSTSSISMASTSMTTTSKVKVISDKQIVGPRTGRNGNDKKFQPNSVKAKIGNKNFQNLKSATKINEKMKKPKENQTVKGKKPLKALICKEKTRSQNLIENRGDTSGSFGGQSIEYLKLIHKEILGLKTFSKIEASKRRDSDKKITDCLQKLNKIEGEISRLKDSNKMSVQDLILEQDQIQEFDAFFSITDQKDLDAFVFKLSRDPVYKNLLKLRMARIGGRKPQLMLRAIMKYLIHDSLLEDYCWTGTERKGSFQDLTILNNTILESIQMQHRLYTEDEYNKYMKNFVNQAKFRLVQENNYNHEGGEEVENEHEEANEEGEENENKEINENADEIEFSEDDEKVEEMMELEYLDDNDSE